jgi:tungstate transport system substrate-binding protein
MVMMSNSTLRAALAALISLLALPTLAETRPIRIAVVNTPAFSGLMDELIADFKASGGRDVEVYGGNDVYERARSGEADLVISHYGKEEVERFVLDGFGAWPQMVFSNQLAIIGPAADPAKIRGLTSAAEALKRIADAKAPFSVNGLPGVGYLSDILWQLAGSPEKGAWYLDGGVAKGKAMKYAEANQAYTIWGALPFLRFKEKNGSQMELLVTADPLLQRVMASIVINKDKVPGADPEAGKVFQDYLLTTRAQAKIAAFRSPAAPMQLWWPIGRSNARDGLED